ncbi:MAG: thiamine pyrophosphate-binding protein, partial [Eubacterium sp.]|nr:thiamine pyrophosphate-binding protein [Eubacterium sp.]
YIADFLVDNGIQTVFGVTGGGAMHLNDSFGHKEGLQFIFNHNEQGSSVAAEAYTRLTGKLAAVNVTSGPGGTNAMTGVLGGWLDSIPMFVVSGQVKRETTTWSTDIPLRQLGDQEYQIVESVKNMTKYAVMVTDEKEIAYHLEKALFLATIGRGGPVWIDVPLDVQAAKIETDELVHFNGSDEERQLLSEEIPAKVSDDLADDILTKIANAKRPVLYAGTGIRLGRAEKEFLKLVDTLKIPVVTAWNANDILPDDSSFFAGRPGTVGTRGGNFAVENADLVLTLASRLNIRLISYNFKDWAKNAYKIVVDIDQNELDKPTLSPDMKVHADIKDLMQALLKRIDEGVYSLSTQQAEVHESWRQFATGLNEKYPAVLPEYYEEKDSLNPYVLIKELFTEAADDEVFITGNGSACVIGFQAAVVKNNTRLFTNSGCASMGYGLPAALGAAVALRDAQSFKGESNDGKLCEKGFETVASQIKNYQGKDGHRVVCIDGDGSLMMNLQELQTISENNLNIKLIVINNNGYHSIRQTQNNLFKNGLVGVCKGNGVSFPPFDKLADTFGFKFVRIDSLDGISEKINEFLNAEGPVLCEAVVSDEQIFSPKLSSKVLPDGKIVSPPIDDMYPFLSREEYEECKVTVQ